MAKKQGKKLNNQTEKASQYNQKITTDQHTAS